MDMTNLFKILDEFHTIFHRHYRYVAGRWWVLLDYRWTTHDARMRMAKALVALVNDMYPEGHSVRRQVTKDYMITRLCAALVPRLRSDYLPGRTEDPDSE